MHAPGAGVPVRSQPPTWPVVTHGVVCQVPTAEGQAPLVVASGAPYMSKQMSPFDWQLAAKVSPGQDVVGTEVAASTGVLPASEGAAASPLVVGSLLLLEQAARTSTAIDRADERRPAGARVCMMHG